MRIVVIRHGQTVWNEKGIMQGHSQNRLSALGKKGVEEASEKIKDEKFDLIFSSPLMRTMQTANIVNRYHNVKIIKDDRLIEDNKGIFTGRRKDSLTDKDYDLFKNHFKECGMESEEEVYDRTYDFLQFIKKNYSDKNLLIVTHAIVAGMIECISEGQSRDEAKDINKYHRFKNAEVKEFNI